MSTPVYNQNPYVGNRPMGRSDAQGNIIPESFEDLSFRGDYTGTNLIYKGFARPGALTSDPVWQIAKMSYDGSNNLLTILWPENSLGVETSEYQFVWDNRATYTYS